MKITSKGQITIPAAIREKFNLFPYTEVEVIEEGDKVVITKLHSISQNNPLHKIYGKYKGKFTTDEIMKLTRS